MSAELATTFEAREAVIERGLHTFMEVGQALAGIRDDRQYRATHETFEDYCLQRWGLSRPRAYALISASEVVSSMEDIGAPAPENERQARELAGLKPDQAAETMRLAHEQTNGKVTASAIKDAREQIAPKPNPPVTDLISKDDLDALNVPPKPEPELFECDGCAGTFPAARLYETDGGYVCDDCVNTESTDEPEPEEPQQPSPVDAYLADDPELENIQYVRRFVKEFGYLVRVQSFDPERLATLLQPVEAEHVLRNLANITNWGARLERSRRGLRIVNGGNA